jgi:predicted TIM-barrel fold metal-dependent hydrolase
MKPQRPCVPSLASKLAPFRMRSTQCWVPTMPLPHLMRHHVGKGVVLSMAYLFGSPYLSNQHYDVARMTRAENEYVADQVEHAHGRLIGFFSVDPLSPSAARARHSRPYGEPLNGCNAESTAARDDRAPSLRC